MKHGWAIAGGIGMGAGFLYLMDPEQGAARRDRLRGILAAAAGALSPPPTTLGEASGINLLPAASRAEAPVPAETIPDTTRLAAAIAGGALAAFGLSRRDGIGVAAGVAGLGLLAGGLAPVRWERLLEADDEHLPVTLRGTVRVDAPANHVFDYCADIRNFPRFLPNVLEVRDLGGDRLLWVAELPDGETVHWECTLTRYVDGELIAWKSVPGSPVESAGLMRFEVDADGSTCVIIRLSYHLKGGTLSRLIGLVLGHSPAQQLHDDLQRVKQVLEDRFLPAGAKGRWASRKQGRWPHQEAG